MNQDFGLSLTPANARRLLRFRETFNIQLLNDLSELAQQERITETDFDPLVCPCNETRLTVTQFLLDCKLRGVVQQNFNREFDETALLHAIHLTKPSAITIIAKNKIVWRLALRCFGLERISEIHTGLSAETVTRRRASVLIYNVGDDDIGRPLYNHANEFAQFIVFESLRDSTTLIPWTLWAHMLFPTMPTPLYARMVRQIPMDWCNIPLYKFAPFYNVCLFQELIALTDLPLLLDRALNTQLRRYRHHLT